MEEEEGLEVNKIPYKEVELSELKSPEYQKMEKIPVRVLGKLRAFLTISNLYKTYEIITQEKIMYGVVFLDDEQYDKYLTFYKDPMANQLRMGMITDGTNHLFVNIQYLPSDINFSPVSLFHFFGYIEKIEKGIPCLEVKGVTRADGINLDLRKQVRLLIDSLITKPKEEQEFEANNEDGTRMREEGVSIGGQ